MHESNIPINNLPDFNGSIEINRCIESPVDEGLIVDVVQRIIGDAGYGNGSISIAIVDDPTIHQLNRQYLQHDYATDVLSFLLNSNQELGHVEGEVIVSQDTASRSAQEYGWSADEELLLYVIHGTLHLTGMDDDTTELRAEMQQAENRYLATAGITRPHSASESNHPAGSDSLSSEDGIRP